MLVERIINKCLFFLSNLFTPLLKYNYMFRSINNHHLATNTKSQSKIKYNASIFTL